jgi:RES domain-containing protein
MMVYRLAQASYINDVSGKGAELHGARWNSKGVAIIYTCPSRALCTVEIAAQTPLGSLPENYQLAHIFVPDVDMEFIQESDLPDNWRSLPSSVQTQKIGDTFISKNKHLIFKVPSATVQGEFNFLINPLHKAFKKVKVADVEPFSFDERIFS